jgi:putative transposase
MKHKKYSESQIAAILKEGADGVPVPELCRTHGMSSASYYKWRSQYLGMEASHMKQLRELLAENARLKKLYAESQLHADILKEAMAKK